MKNRSAALHVAVSLALGGIISGVSPAKWVAATFWASALLFLLGSLAVFEDSLPGGFDNPDSSEGAPIVNGVGAFYFWTKSLAVCALLVTVGIGLQFWGACRSIPTLVA